MKQAASGLATLFRPDVIITSPLVRARQTAALLSEAYGGMALKEDESLANGDNEALLKALGSLKCDRVILVGHEPYMSGTFSLLLAGDERAMAVNYKKGGAGLISFPGAPQPGQGMLEWMLTPAVGRSLRARRK